MINSAMARSQVLDFCGIGIALEKTVSTVAVVTEEIMKTGPSYRTTLTRNKPRRKPSRDVFDTTIQKTQVWLNDLMSELDWEDKPQKTYMACVRFCIRCGI